MNVFYNNTKRNIYIFVPDSVLHLLHFLCSPIIFFSLILDFIKLLCSHDFSRVTFATELSTNIVYKSSFVIDYNYISIFFSLD